MKSKSPSKFSPRGNALAAIVVAGIAALVIGCGGGGTSGTTGVTDATSITASTATATTSSATATTSTATTSSTASSSSTSSTSSTSGLTGGSGALQPNVIFYTQLTGKSDSSFDLRYITPDGASDVPVVTNIPATVRAVALNPTTGKYLFAAQSAAGANFGLYTNATGPSVVGAQPLVSPTYNDISQVAVSQDNTTILYIAALTSSSDYLLYRLPTSGSGSPTALGPANSVAISPDSDTIAYSQFPTSGGVTLPNTQIFIGKLSTGTAIQITHGAVNHDFPQFSKDGRSVVYSQTGSGSPYSVVISNLTGSQMITLPNPSGLDERGPSMNSAGTTISFVGQGGSAHGIYTVAVGATAPVSLKQSPLISFAGTYWTSTGGRGVRPSGIAGSTNDRRHPLPN